MENIIEILNKCQKPVLIMPIGIPGSGKTTFINKLNNEHDIDIVSPDDIRQEILGDVQDQSQNKKVWNIAHNRTYDKLKRGKSVVIDATHTDYYLRKSAINEYRSHGAKTIIGIVFDIPIETAKQRNSARDRKVSVDVIERMHNKLYADYPKTEEGFDFLLKI